MIKLGTELKALTKSLTRSGNKNPLQEARTLMNKKYGYKWSGFWRYDRYSNSANPANCSIYNKSGININFVNL